MYRQSGGHLGAPRSGVEQTTVTQLASSTRQDNVVVGLAVVAAVHILYFSTYGCINESLTYLMKR